MVWKKLSKAPAGDPKLLLKTPNNEYEHEHEYLLDIERHTLKTQLNDKISDLKYELKFEFEFEMTVTIRFS